MGSSKYEFEPDKFNEDVKNKRQVTNYFKEDLERVLNEDYYYLDGSKMSNKTKREILTKVHKEFLEELGVTNKTKAEYKLAEDKIKQRYVEEWHHPQKDMNFNLSDLDGTTCEYSYNNTDRDKKTIYNGEIKYFRNWNGRLLRGKVYHNINNMWWVILNDKEYTNVASFELFDATEEDYKIRRLVKDRKPKEYLDRIDKINQASTKELINELKRRGVK